MLDEPKQITAFDDPVLNISDNTEEMRKEEDDLLNLIAEIIIEIIVSKNNERNRIYSEK